MRNQYINEFHLDEKYEYRYLPSLRNPIIKFPDTGNDVWCPLPYLLSKRITESIYFDINQSIKFGASYGRAFERYIGEVLSRTGWKKIPERSKVIRGKGEYRSFDWIAESDDAYIYLLNVKQKDQFFLIKLILLILMMKLAQQDLEGFYNYDFDDRKKKFIYIVTLEDWYIMNFNYFDNKYRTIKEKKQAKNMNLDIVDKIPSFSSSVETFEYVVECMKHFGIEEVLSSKDEPRFINDFMDA